MLQPFENRMIAAGAQFVAVLLVGTVVLADLGAPQPGSLAQAFGDPRLLKWAFLVLAALAAKGFRHSESRSALRLRQETQVSTRGRGKRLQMDLMLHLRVATAAMAVLTITPPPDLLSRALEALLDPRTTALAWAGIMSVGVAYFGAAASAARRALHP